MVKNIVFLLLLKKTCVKINCLLQLRTINHRLGGLERLLSVPDY